jgi:hypothetical protein
MQGHPRPRPLTAPQAPATQPGFCRATLVRVSRCPARPGYRELHFDLEGTPWSWCFPPGPEPGERAAAARVRSLVLRPGPHGLIAEALDGRSSATRRPAGLGPGLAAELAISGAAIFVDGFLLWGASGGHASESAVAAPAMPHAGGAR